MQKLKYFFSYYFSILCFWTGKEDGIFYILNEEQMHETHGLKLKEVIYKDVIEERTVVNAKRGELVRKPFFLVCKNERDAITKLKKHLLIGPQNFLVHEELKDTVALLENRLEAKSNDLTSYVEQIMELESFLKYLEVQVTPKVFLKYKQAREGQPNARKQQP